MTSPAWHETLAGEPWAHDFFALLRRFEALNPHWPRLGEALRPSQEALRLGQEPALDFAPAALASYEPQAGGAPAGVPRVGVRLFGLLGPQGPMPLHLTEFVRERLRQRNDPTPARFLDVFHHRLLSLFYRAWAQAQPAVQADRPAEDRYARWLGAFCGLEPAALPPGRISDRAQRFQAGLLATRSRHPEGLRKLLAQDFGVPVRIAGHVLHRLVVEPADRTRLGATQLGRSTTIGHRVHDRQSKFRVVLGPVGRARHDALLPGGSDWPRLVEWVRLYAGMQWVWDVELRLAADERPAPRLGPGLRLGIAAWIGGRPRTRPHRPLRLRPATSFIALHPSGDRHG